MKRSTKRSIIIAIYISITIFFISLLILAIIPEPSCVDGVRNQNELGIDCGGVCPACAETLLGDDIIVQNTNVVYGGENKYDVVAALYNPNSFYGGKNLNYTIDILDDKDSVIVSRSGDTFILPNENKYIVEVGLESNQRPVKARVSINSIEWVKFTSFDSPQILVKNQKFGFLESGINYAEASGLVSNESAYDFENIMVNVVLENEQGVPVAVNKTVINTLNSEELREFYLTWPHKFPGNIKSADMQAETNVFDSQNFMKKYLPGGKYQELYEETKR